MSRKIVLDKRTKIIATLGPASVSVSVMEKMFRAGVDVVRLNASHQSDFEVLVPLVDRVRKTANKVGKSVGIFLDLQGPKIRIGKVKNNRIVLEHGRSVSLTTRNVLGCETELSVSYSAFVKDVQVGDPVYIDDGKIQLRVEKKSKDSVLCKVLKGGPLSNHKGINLPHTQISASAITAKDKKDVLTAIRLGVHYIALSFVSESSDIVSLRRLMDKNGGEHIKIIAKIERQHALDNIADIVKVSDAVMVARGDLGIEIGIANVPRAQKLIIREANRRFKPVIVATQMLESMIQSYIATRAEVSDVANAVYDRCDAVMLSGETAVGIDPVNVVRTMTDICFAADRHMVEIKKEHTPRKDFFLLKSRAISCCRAADQIATDNNVDAIMAFTSSGTTPLIASKLNPAIPIISPTDDDVVLGQVSLFRGVIPLKMPKKFTDIHRWTDMIDLALSKSKTDGLIHKGDVLVVTAGRPIGRSNGINSIRIVDVE